MIWLGGLLGVGNRVTILWGNGDGVTKVEGGEGGGRG